jgi:hypothetical protein
MVAGPVRAPKLPEGTTACTVTADDENRLQPGEAAVFWVQGAVGSIETRIIARNSGFMRCRSKIVTLSALRARHTGAAAVITQGTFGV